MREMSLRARAPWLAVPVVAFGVTVAVNTTAGAEREPLTIDVAGVLIAGIVVIFVAPLGAMLALVRTRWGWTAGVLLLIGLCVAAPAMAAAASDESSTAGLHLLLIPFCGTAVAVLVGLVEWIFRRRDLA